MNTRTRIEPLESRIAPATFFVNGTNLTITDSTGADAAGSVGELAAATASGATKAILLQSGDSLVFDLNGDHLLSAGEPTLIKITGGQAMAFFTNLNTDPTLPPADQVPRFDLNEFTGLAAGADLKATITADLHGSIDTLLDAGGAFTATVRQAFNISGLDITGSVFGNIQAGGSISSVTFKAPKTGAQDFDVRNIFTGSAANNGISFNGGGTALAITFTQAVGVDAGDIFKIKASRRVDEIRTGNGGDNTTGASGAGGDLTEITLTGLVGAGLFGGNGGAVTTSGAAGAGGALNKINLTLKTDTGSDIFVQGGDGGASVAGAGGPGGALTGVSLTTLGHVNQAINFLGGNGGGGGGTGVGGVGGALLETKLNAKGYLASAVKFSAGDGGAGGTGGANGGDGGAVTKASMTGIGSNSRMEIFGGNGGAAGGNGFTGGAGGAVSMATFVSTGYLESRPAVIGGNGGSGGAGSSAGGAGGSVSAAVFKFVDVDDKITARGGTGGDGGTGGGNGGAGGNVSKVSASASDSNEVNFFGGDGGAAAGDGFTGGAGGAVTNSTILTLAYMSSGFEVHGGKGGDGGAGNSKGGAGGQVAMLKATIGESDGDIDFLGGAGGAGGGTGGDGGRGGDLSATTFTNKNYVNGTLTMRSGAGGSAQAGAAFNGGNGGDLSAVTITNIGGIDKLDLRAGDAGNSSATTGNGGDGGNLTKVTVNSLADILSSESIRSGNGGDSNNTGNGGKGGMATGTKVTDKFGAQGQWTLAAGSGGNGNGAGGKGGNGGDLLTTTFKGPNSNVLFGGVKSGDNDGGTGATSAGGKGGNINGLKGSAGTALIVAQAGGSADTGTGGAGGLIDNVALAVTKFARIVAAGDGGSVNTGGTAGNGGAVTNVKITGSGVIGDFSSNFSVNGDGDIGMGGLIAGLGGAVNGVFDINRNGSITSVTATRIAAILAGANAGSGVTNFNAAKSITGLVASIIGADVDGDRQFDWVEGVATELGFQLPGAPGTTDTDDTPLDGLVIVKSGAFTPPAGVTPLKLVAV